MHPKLDALLKLAKTHLRSGQPDQAEALYRKVLQTSPRCAEALHFLGLSAMHRGKLDIALDLVQKSIDIEPFKPDYHNNLATVLGRMNLSPQALGAAQRAIDLKDDFPRRTGQHDEAIPRLRKAAELRSQGPGGAGHRRHLGQRPAPGLSHTLHSLAH